MKQSHHVLVRFNGIIISSENEQTEIVSTFIERSSPRRMKNLHQNDSLRMETRYRSIR